MIFRGFTVIEVLIVIAISALVMGALSNIFITFSSSYAFQNANINNSVSATSFLNEMNDLALQSNTIVASRTFSGTSYTTGSTTVIFEIPSVNSSGDVLSNTYDYAVLFASSTELYRIFDADASSARRDETKRITDVLQNLTLTYDNASPAAATNTTVDISTRTVSRGSNVITHLKQTVYLRNK